MGTEQEVHADSIHFSSEPEGYMCGVWIALENIGEEQGPLLVHPGSHLGGERERQKVLTVQKRQAVIWGPDLLHGGAPQTNKNATRYSQVTHYYFEGVKPWRPIRSKNIRHYFEPHWIAGRRTNYALMFKNILVNLLFNHTYHR